MLTSRRRKQPSRQKGRVTITKNGSDTWPTCWSLVIIIIIIIIIINAFLMRRIPLWLNMCEAQSTMRLLRKMITNISRASGLTASRKCRECWAMGGHGKIRHRTVISDVQRTSRRKASMVEREKEFKKEKKSERLDWVQHFWTIHRAEIVFKNQRERERERERDEIWIDC